MREPGGERHGPRGTSGDMGHSVARTFHKLVVVVLQRRALARHPARPRFLPQATAAQSRYTIQLRCNDPGTVAGRGWWQWIAWIFHETHAQDATRLHGSARRRAGRHRRIAHHDASREQGRRDQGMYPQRERGTEAARCCLLPCILSLAPLRFLLRYGCQRAQGAAPRGTVMRRWFTGRR